MKKLLIFTVSLIINMAFLMAQTPNVMIYQAVVRNGSNELVTNKSIGVRVSILEDSNNGTAVFQETHSVTTNGNGLVTLEVGNGTKTLPATLDDIEWGTHVFFIRTEFDITGGTNYNIVQTQQVMTVPYSYHAETASKADTAAYALTADYKELLNKPEGTKQGDILYWDTLNLEWQILPAGNDGDVLTMDSTSVPYWRATAPDPVLASVVIDSIVQITQTTAKVYFSVTDDGGAPLVLSGICYGTTQNFISEGQRVLNGIGTPSFSLLLNNLVPNTVYSLCALAANSAGVQYGTATSFTTLSYDSLTCPGTPRVKDVDGNVYSTVMIGKQCWMRENLRTTKYADRTPIQNGGDITSYDEHYYYYPGNNSDNKNPYGLLYNWAALMNGELSSNSNPSGVQGVCPDGWHLPSNAEWDELFDYVNSQPKYVCDTNYTIAKALSSTEGWESNGVECLVGYAIDNNATGFSALPADLFFYGYGQIGTKAFFWSSTETGEWSAPFYVIGYADSIVQKMSGDKGYGRSVRCVLD